MQLSKQTTFTICLILLVFCANLALASKSKKIKLQEMKCGICQVIMKNLESIRVNSKRVTNQGPYSMVTDVLIDESLTHICGVSMESFKAMEFENMEAMETCYEFVWSNDEAIEDAMRQKAPIDEADFCDKTVPVCAGFKAELIPKPKNNLPLPKHTKDVQKKPKPDEL